MRFINVQAYRLEEFFNEQVPPYAILSHTWGNDQDEVSFRDITKGNTKGASANHWPIKLERYCKQAAKDGLNYVWIDTCCIDKTNSVELGEAINSMFRWYKEATICYAYLTDVTVEAFEINNPYMESEFSISRWFQRGWTLQELLAPGNLYFYNSTWTFLGSKKKIKILRLVEKITGIPRPFLRGTRELKNASIAQRMSWASRRITKRKEDITYCLLGIFDIMIPMIYGEGDRAFIRLQEELIKKTRDDLIFAWGLESTESASADSKDMISAGVFATSPADFINSSYILPEKREIKSTATFIVDGGCVRSNLPLYTDSTGQLFGLLNCGSGFNGNDRMVVGIPLCSGQFGEYIRPEGCCSQLLPVPEATTSTSQIYIKTERQHKTATVSSSSNYFEIEDPGEAGLKLIEVEPQEYWLEEESLITINNNPSKNTAQQYWIRFRPEDKGSTDFLVLLEPEIPGSQAQPQYHLMTPSQTTSLKDLLLHSSNMRPAAFGKKIARDNSRGIQVTVEQDTTDGQKIYIVRLTETATLPTVTVDGTFELELQAAKLEFEEVAKAEDNLYLEMENFNRQRGTAYTLESIGRRLAEMKEEKDHLEKIQKWQAIKLWDYRDGHVPTDNRGPFHIIWINILCMRQESIIL
ncbi:HET-domain-containing protein [Aspergillus bertholletiae]|uniref:HET-domain-containing protein n=1 Tax=Aspergillus bertholletiae TaxID=1226010 RepID=A0A5N7B4R7_9EURO|nr:HET-domain-containing protein [Aspergillus bertholletiae]